MIAALLRKQTDVIDDHEALPSQKPMQKQLSETRLDV